MFVNKSCQTIDVIQTTKYAFIWSQNVHFITIIKVPLIKKCPIPETLITTRPSALTASRPPTTMNNSQCVLEVA